MSETPILPTSAQLESILARYRKTDITKDPQRKALADEINQSRLPRYHKEVLLAVFLAKSSEEITLALHLLRSQEVLRHMDALGVIESKALTERLNKINRG